MMNILAIGLVLTSLVTASIWSPSTPPVRHDDRREVIVKEGHRVVMVEYDKEADGSTKVLISPQDVVDSKETEVKPADGKFSGPKELVCDAFGKCKHKLATALGKTKDTVQEAEEHAKEVASRVVGKAKEGEEHVKKAASGAVGHRVVVVEYDKEADGSTKVLISPQDVVDSKETEVKPADGKFSGPKELVCDAFGKCKHKLATAFGKTKDTVQEAEEHAKEVASGVVGKAKEGEEHVKEAVSGAVGKAKDSVSQGVGEAKKVAGDVVGTLKDSALKTKNFDVVDSPKRIGEDIKRNVSGKGDEGVDQVKEQAKETLDNVHEVGQKSLGEILSKLKEVTYDVIRYINMISRDKVNAVVGLIHMLGFSTAYGMCVWVTFVSSYILGRYLPRQQFGMVQSRIYPVYFKAMAYCVSAALLGHLVSQKRHLFSSFMEMFQGLSLLSALLMVLSNMVFLEPKATKLMYERMKIEKEEGRGIACASKEGLPNNSSATVARPPANVVVAETQDVLRLNEKLKRLNTYSSALNVSTLVVLTWHMAYMGQRLQATK